jgi:predicted lysophospholipase L1 biosynthesis ABC-type transport system permease subunit
MRDRLRQFARLVGAVVITVAVAGAAGAAAIYLTGPSGLISCAPVAAPASPDPIPRWVIAAGIPALVAALIGAFFALAAQRVLGRLIGLVLAAVLAGGTFYAVYALLPAACRP